MAAEFDINGITYTSLPLDAFTQLHVCRKTAPLFVGMAKELASIVLLHDIPDDDLESVLKRIMPFIRRKDSGTWAAIYNKDAGVFAYSDIDSGVMLEIMFNVLMNYIPPFFDAVDRLALGIQQETADTPT